MIEMNLKEYIEKIEAENENFKKLQKEKKRLEKKGQTEEIRREVERKDWEIKLSKEAILLHKTNIKNNLKLFLKKEYFTLDDIEEICMITAHERVVRSKREWKRELKELKEGKK